jgi:hypothetical protein
VSGPPLDWADRVRRLHQEANGVVTVHIMQPSALPALERASSRGDEQATRLLDTLTRVSHRLKTAPPRKPERCICCPMPVRSMYFGVQV